MDNEKKPRIETKDLKFTLTDFDAEAGVFTGYASVWGVVDAYGDVVKKGAFKKTLKEKKKFPMLWSHSVDEPIGVLELEEDDYGLRVKRGELNLDVQRGREVRSLMKQGAVSGLSIGYEVVQKEVDERDKLRILKEIKLWEVSPCVFPALEPARVLDIKSAEPGEMKPYPNEHACRLRDPSDFEDGTMRSMKRKHEGKEYRVIIGKLKDEDTMSEQAYRYPIDIWSEKDARAHCRSHDGQFEPASPEGSSLNDSLSYRAALSDDIEKPALDATSRSESDTLHSYVERELARIRIFQEIWR